MSKDVRSIIEDKVSTSPDRQPWQEFLDRHASVPAQKALEAAPAVEGFAGSWAATYANGFGSQTALGATTPATASLRSSKLGQPGLPEINFVPYNHGTNRFGLKGPSLVGHPISFSIVGPTLKTPFNDWQWLVTDNSALPGSGDVLTIDHTTSVLGGFSEYGNPTSPTYMTLPHLYGISEAAFSTRFHGGLYLVISQTGEKGSFSPVEPGGLWDGFVAGARNPLQAKDPTSRYEIFRVIAVDEGEAPTKPAKLLLDPGKRLADYFDIPPGPNPAAVRGITLFEPAAARLAAVPGSGPTGQEQVFVTVPPEFGLTSDLLPPMGDPVTQLPGSFWGGGVDPWDPLDVQRGTLAFLYQETALLPIPTPLRSGRARAESRAADDFAVTPPPAPPPAPPAPPGSATGLGSCTIVAEDAVSADDIDKILRIYKTETRGTVVFSGGATYNNRAATPDDFLGWYQIVSVDIPTNRYILRRSVEIDPASGHPFHGLQEALTVQATSSADARVTLHYTLHDSVRALFRGHFDADKVSASRLTTLIDPSWVERSAKQPEILPGSSPARADRAIFDTASSSSGRANPGSLLDLGFRMVLFPAKLVSEVAVPDFSRPIDTRDVILDPLRTNEPQYITVDYSAGVVTLSHRPVPGPGCDVAPDGLVVSGTENPRRELVLFASFVPYSMEAGQRGSAVRVTAHPVSATSCDQPAQSDVFSDRTVLKVLAGQTITSGSGALQVLDVENDFGSLPEAGFVEILKSGTLAQGRGAASDPLFTAPDGVTRSSTFGYIRKIPGFGIPARTRLIGLFGGALESGALSTGSIDGDCLAVLRHDIAAPEKTGTSAVLFPRIEYQQDTTYGSAKRASTLRFQDTLLRSRADGSLAITPDLSGVTRLIEDVLQSGVISGGGITAVQNAPNDWWLTIGETTVHIGGKRWVVPQGRITGLLDSSTYYVFVDETAECLSYAVSTVLPVEINGKSGPLLGKLWTGGASPPEITDLRNRMTDLDKRIDITVGVSGTASTGPHFDTVGAAVAYASEISSPTASGSRTGPKFRIRVLGRTVEPETPIKIRTDGLVIEGSPKISSLAGDVDPPFITWAADNPLFDFNGHDDIVFRGLTMVPTNSGPTPDPSTPLRYCFTNSVGTATRVVVDGCRAFPASGARLEGFLAVHTGPILPHGGKLADSVFSHNYATCSDFGFLVTNYGQAQNCRFVDNILVGTGQPVLEWTTVLEQTAAIWLSPQDSGGLGWDATLHFGNQVRGNRITGTLQTGGVFSGLTRGFQKGIVSYGARDVIELNYVEDTLKQGIQIRGVGGDAVRTNYLRNCYGDNPTVAAASTSTSANFAQPAVLSSVGIQVGSTAGMNQNQVLYIGAGGHYEIISVDSGTDLTVKNLGYPGGAAPAAIVASATPVSIADPKIGIHALEVADTDFSGFLIEGNIVSLATAVVSDYGIFLEGSPSSNMRAAVSLNRLVDKDAVGSPVQSQIILQGVDGIDASHNTCSHIGLDGGDCLLIANRCNSIYNLATGAGPDPNPGGTIYGLNKTSIIFGVLTPVANTGNQ